MRVLLQGLAALLFAARPAGAQPRLEPLAPRVSPAPAASLSLPSLPAALTGPALLPPPACVSFFFNDHDASASYGPQLRAFVERQDSVLLESVRPGPQRAVFQAVADGALDREQALARLSARHEPMDKAVLEALRGSGVKVLPESPMTASAAQRRRRMMARAEAAISAAYDSFIEEGDAAAAVRDMRTFQASMAATHRLREKALLDDLRARVRSAPGRNVGVVFGLFHTWPYEKLKESGVPVQAEFHPSLPPGRAGMLPYNRPLLRFRLRQVAAAPKRERKELISYLLFHELLDARFRNATFAADKPGLYSKILERLTWGDFKRLAADLSAFRLDSDARTEERLPGFALRWLFNGGFIRPSERRYFRAR